MSDYPVNSGAAFLGLTAATEYSHALAVASGWWEYPGPPEAVISRFVANVHAELSELWEAYRQGEMDSPCDKSGLPLSCLEEEMADVLIRVFDTAGFLGVDLARACALKCAYNQTRGHRHGGKRA